MVRIEILDVPVDIVSIQEAQDTCRHFLRDGNQHFIITPNPEFVVAAQRDARYKKILQHADLALADGVGMTWAARRQKHRLWRIPGVDFIPYLCTVATEETQSIFLLGGQEGVAAKAADALRKTCPGVQVVGAISGGVITPNPSVENTNLIEKINHTKPDIILVALGHPKQEQWIFKFLDLLPTVKIAIGVGGSFDYLSGTVARAPYWMRTHGLEWLHRLIFQPYRWRRIVDAVIVFPWLIITRTGRKS